MPYVCNEDLDTIKIAGDSLELPPEIKSRFKKFEIGFSFEIAADNLSLEPNLFIDSYDPETGEDETVHAEIEEDDKVVDIETFDILRSETKVHMYFSNAWEEYPEIKDFRTVLLGTLHKYLVEHYKISASLEWGFEELRIDVTFERYGTVVLSLDFRIPQEEADKVVRDISVQNT